MYLDEIQLFHKKIIWKCVSQNLSYNSYLKTFVVKWSGACFCFYSTYGVASSAVKYFVRKHGTSGSGRLSIRISEPFEGVREIIKNEPETSICHLSQ
jgi:hypothetical protein